MTLLIAGAVVWAFMVSAVLFALWLWENLH